MRKKAVARRIARQDSAPRLTDLPDELLSKILQLAR